MGLLPRQSSLKIWRLSNYNDLSGRGGLIASGRWHYRGRPIVYCSGSAECAILEVQQHLDVPQELMPDSYLLLLIEVPKTLRVDSIEESKLAADWRKSYASTQDIGDEWLASVSAPILSVPSAICEGVSNYLINPVHRTSEFLKISKAMSIREYTATK